MARIAVANQRRRILEIPFRRAAMSVDLARVDDLDDIRALLRSNGLPTEVEESSGVEAHWVWREADGNVGTIWLDIVGTAGVLRSLVTDAGFGGRHVATALCDRAEDEAQRRGSAAVYLLTESAGGFFERRGYRTVDRKTVPD